MHNFSQSQAIGHRAERLVYMELQARNYHPQYYPNFNQEGCDLRVNGLPVEVKFAHKTRRYCKGKRYHRWQWCIHPTSQKIHGDWLLILVAQTRPLENWFYVLPGSVAGDRTQIQLTSHPKKYSGWLSEWLNRWDVITYLSNGVYQNGGPLFHQWGVA